MGRQRRRNRRNPGYGDHAIPATREARRDLRRRFVGTALFWLRCPHDLHLGPRHVRTASAPPGGILSRHWLRFRFRRRPRSAVVRLWRHLLSSRDPLSSERRMIGPPQASRFRACCRQWMDCSARAWRSAIAPRSARQRQTRVRATAAAGAEAAIRGTRNAANRFTFDRRLMKTHIRQVGAASHLDAREQLFLRLKRGERAVDLIDRSGDHDNIKVDAVENVRFCHGAFAIAKLHDRCVGLELDVGVEFATFAFRGSGILVASQG